ncbi:MAG TPA: hypothetical protein VFH18_01340 [Erysipelotrichaceae bacterium]|nr:hypothetical protein [Erysipelotrichaceae bacterium]
MADSLKISPTMIKQPAVSRNQSDPQVPFQIKDVTKVNNLNTSKQTSSQNQTLLNSDGPKLLLDILRNPESTTQFLHSLYLLQEVNQLIPLDNLSLNSELELLFQSIFLKSDSLLTELLNQSKQTSVFKGELFDWIRNLLVQYPMSENSLIQLLKSMNQIKSKPQYHESLLNQAEYLEKEFINPKQNESIKQFIESLHNNSDQLSKQLKDIIQLLEKSILFNPQTQKNIGIMQYNLSRYLMDTDINDVLESFKGLLADDFSKFELLVKEYIKLPYKSINTSNMLDKITELLDKQIKQSSQLDIPYKKLEKIVISLLSSPSNFVPLLHFILPMQGNKLQAYSEVWVDIEDSSQKIDQSIHVLCAIEIENMGSFEIELWNRNNHIKIHVYCLESKLDLFKPIVSKFSKHILDSKYSLDNVQIYPLIQKRSLMDVFEHLSLKQSGLDQYA